MADFTAADIYLRDNPDVMQWAQGQVAPYNLEPGADYRAKLQQYAQQHWNETGQYEAGRPGWGTPQTATSTPTPGGGQTTTWNQTPGGGQTTMPVNNQQTGQPSWMNQAPSWYNQPPSWMQQGQGGLLSGGWGSMPALGGLLSGFTPQYNYGGSPYMQGGWGQQSRPNTSGPFPPANTGSNMLWTV